MRTDETDAGVMLVSMMSSKERIVELVDGVSWGDAIEPIDCVED